MKQLKYTILGMLLVLSGCSDFLNINDNPNAPSQSVPDPVLAGALVTTAGIYMTGTSGFAPYWAGYWAASGTYSSAGNVTQNFKLQTSSFGQSPWGGLYLNISNYTYVENSGAGYQNYGAIAKIMKVYGYHTLVDCYGSIPYSASEKGFLNLAPTYDDDKTVYEKLIKQLDTAIVIIQAAKSISGVKVVPKTADVMFAGDMNKWIKLANTMKLRLLLRMSNVASEAAFITAEIAKIAAPTAGASPFLDKGEDANINPGYQNAAGLQNPFWSADGLGVGGDVGNRDFNRTSQYSLQFFQGSNSVGDPRIDYVFRAPGDPPGKNTKSVPYFSIPWGTPPTTQYVTASTSGFGIGVMPSASAPVFFLPAFESFFLQAEAAQRGWLNAGNEQTLYETGIEESMRILGVPNYVAAAKKYYTSGTVNADWSASTDKLQAIIVQKWAANCSIDCMESWCDIRRTGYPNDVPQTLDPTAVSTITPYRILYPAVEYTTNSANVPTGVTPYAPKVFWHQ